MEVAGSLGDSTQYSGQQYVRTYVPSYPSCLHKATAKCDYGSLETQGAIDLSNMKEASVQYEHA